MNEQDDALYKILSWRDSLKSYIKPAENTYKVRETLSIVNDDESKWGSNFQGIFVDVDWSTHTMEEFKKLKFND